MSAESHSLSHKIICVFRDTVKKLRHAVQRRGRSSRLATEKDWCLVDRRNICRYSKLPDRSDVTRSGTTKSYNDKELGRIIAESWKQCTHEWAYNKSKRRGLYKEYLSGLEPHAWLQKYAGDETDTVLAFCQKNRILQELKAAISLTKKTFSSLQKLSVGLSRDPEWETEKVVLSVTLGCGSEEAFAAYDKFVTKWIDAAEWEARKWFCLSYDLT